MVLEMNSGQTMLKVGSPITVVPIVLSGILKVTRINEDGQEMLLYYVREGEGCAMTFACGMMGQSSLVKGSGEEEGSLLCVPVTVMDDWMTNYYSWKKFVLSTILNEFMEVIKSVDEVSFKKMDDRLVTFLKEKSKIGSSSLINISHQQIANELGTNRVVISRLLKKLENEKKLLLYRNQIKLLRSL
ncbi:MAG TPA: Crp/Fnr family transcriptional regulator [Hanamia sp.]|nr:Crp/Fnr family transcriptional regulator [Hanamia sp.]